MTRQAASKQEGHDRGNLVVGPHPSLWRNPGMYVGFAVIGALLVVFVAVLLREGPHRTSSPQHPTPASVNAPAPRLPGDGLSADPVDTDLSVTHEQGKIRTPLQSPQSDIQKPSNTGGAAGPEKVAAENRVEISPDALFAKASPAVVCVVVRDENFREIGLGSGFFVADDGTLVTNCHVVKGAKFATVVLPTGATFFVDGILATDETADLAILKVNGKSLPYLNLAPASETPAVGMRVYAIGNPRGLTNTLSEGLVSGLRGNPGGPEIIQTTAAISPGSSGGPLLDPKGQVVGVTTAYLAESQNLNFAVPASKVSELLGKSSTAHPSPLASAGGTPLVGQAADKLHKAWEAMTQERWSEAVRILQDLQKSSPENHAVWYALGSLHLQLGSSDLAIGAFKNAISLKPDFAFAYNDLGVAYGKIGLRAEEAEAYKAAVRLQPDYALPYFNLGVCHFNAGRYHDAIAYLKSSIRLDPGSAQSYRLLGLCYQRIGYNAEAVRAFQQESRLRETHSPIAHENATRQEDLAPLLDRLDKEFHPKYRAEAVASVNRWFTDVGQTPDGVQMKLRLWLTYMQLAKAEGALPYSVPTPPTEDSTSAERMRWIDYRRIVRLLVSNAIVDNTYVGSAGNLGLGLSLEEAELLAIRMTGDIMNGKYIGRWPNVVDYMLGR